MEELTELTRVSVDANRIVEQAEQAERVRRLEFFELYCGLEPLQFPTHLLEHKELYTMHLLSDMALEQLVQGNEGVYEQEISRGKMMNPIIPTKREEAKYVELFKQANRGKRNPIEYESVWKQHTTDLIPGADRPARPGRYRFFGLRDPELQKLIASLTLRQPPKEHGEEMAAYIEQAEHGLQRVQFQPFWDDSQTFRQISTTAEIDTIIVHPDFRKAGLRLVNDMLTQLQVEHDLPEHFMYYRSNGIFMQGKDGRQVHPPGANNASNAFFVQKLGFTDMGDRSDAYDVMVREISSQRELFVANTRWTFGCKSTSKLLERVASLINEQQLVDGGSRLIFPT